MLKQVPVLSLLFAWLALSGGGAWAHQPIEVNLYVLANLNEERLELNVEFASILCEVTKDLKFNEKVDEAALAAPLADWFHENCPVKIDGIAVRPLVTVESEKLLGAQHISEFLDLTMIYADLSYPVKLRPRTIELEWGLFVEEPAYGWLRVADEDQDPSMIVVQFKVYKKYRDFVLKPEDPGYMWRPPVEVPALSFPVTTHAGGGMNPLGVQVALGLIAGSLALLLLTIKAPWVLALLVFLVGAAALAVVQWAPERVGISTGSVAAVPSEALAVEVFEDRLRNIYRSFDYVEDEQIYEALAQSVEGDLLDTMYTDIYQSLILADEGGGARASVKEVKIDETNFLGPAEDASGAPDTPEALGEGAYKVASGWSVRGDVTHYGHTHTRINKYRADCTVSNINGQWKITDVDVTEQKRIDPNES